MTESDNPLPLDIGIIIAGRMDAETRQLVAQSIRRFGQDLRHWFPGFHWRIGTTQRRDIGEFRREESSELLRQAAEIRGVDQQDVTLLITADELIARYRPFALAALSRPLDAAVISTARLIGESNTSDTVVDRLATLMMHALAHIAGLRASADRQHLLHHPQAPGDLDAMQRFDERDLVDLRQAFREIADTRLEDAAGPSSSRWRFALKAININRSEIADAVRAARPWEFPQRLSRLSTAAVSTLAVLLMTAEGWDLGLSQSASTLALTSLFVLALTTTFVVHRQQLLLSRHQHLSEQLIVTRTAALLIVVTGLATTWSAALLLALLATCTLFENALIAAWAVASALEADAVGWTERLKMASFSASISLLIGALGASFEDQHHFRHVIFVDEEL